MLVVSCDFLSVCMNVTQSNTQFQYISFITPKRLRYYFHCTICYDPIQYPIPIHGYPIQCLFVILIPYECNPILKNSVFFLLILIPRYFFHKYFSKRMNEEIVSLQHRQDCMYVHHFRYCLAIGKVCFTQLWLR